MLRMNERQKKLCDLNNLETTNLSAAIIVVTIITGVTFLGKKMPFMLVLYCNSKRTFYVQDLQNLYVGRKMNNSFFSIALLLINIYRSLCSKTTP